MNRTASTCCGIAEGAVLVLGGRSEIGLEVARRLAPGRCNCVASHLGAAPKIAIHS